MIVVVVIVEVASIDEYDVDEHESEVSDDR